MEKLDLSLVGNINREPLLERLVVVPNNTAPCSTTYNNLTIGNIKKAVYSGEIKTENYVLLYLYQPDDEISVQFLKEYGVQLNHRLRKELPLFTIYTKETFNNWNSKLTPSEREELSQQFNTSDNAEPRYGLMQKLAVIYKINKHLPALVIIDSRGANGYPEQFASISFASDNSCQMIYYKICKILDTIDANPNCFDKIKETCNGRVGYRPSDLYNDIEEYDPKSFYNFIYGLIQKNNETIETCAENMGVSRGALTEYMHAKKRIKLDRIFLMALHLRMSLDDLDWVIRDYSDASQNQIDEWRHKKTDRMKIIADCIKHKKGDVFANTQLYDTDPDLVLDSDYLKE